MAVFALPYWTLLMRMHRSGLEYPCFWETISAVNCSANFSTQGTNTGVGAGVDRGMPAGAVSAGAGVKAVSRSMIEAMANGVGVTVAMPSLLRSKDRPWWNHAKDNRLTPSSRSVAAAVRMLSYSMR